MGSGDSFPVHAHLDALRDSAPTAYRDFLRSVLPNVPGVYLITALSDGNEEMYYVGRTRRLRTRLYQHLMSNLKGSSLKRYMVKNHEFADGKAAKQFILDCCRFRVLPLGDDTEAGSRERGILEGYAMGVLQPRYGFYREH